MKGGLKNEKMTNKKALTCRGLRQGEELDSTSFRRSESLAALYANGNGHKVFAKIRQIVQTAKLMVVKLPLINLYFNS